MSLRPEPDATEARWFTDSGDSWMQLCCLGPSGFARYGRLFHRLAPGMDEAEPDDLASLEGDLGPEMLRLLVDVLCRHTTTPADCFFGLWDGFGDIHGSPSVGVLTAGRRKSRQRSAPIPPAFPPEVMSGPKVVIPNRSYFLFRGPLAEAGQWGAAELVPGRARRINSPNLMWPADHAWCSASEVDQPWTGIAGSVGLLDELLAHPDLDVELIEPSDSPPYWRG